MKSGNLNFLEPSGPLQDCNGTALPLRLVGFIINQFVTMHGHANVNGVSQHSLGMGCRHLKHGCILYVVIRLYSLLGAFQSTVRILLPICPSVCLLSASLSAWNSLAPNGRIFVGFDI